MKPFYMTMFLLGLGLATSPSKFLYTNKRPSCSGLAYADTYNYCACQKYSKGPLDYSSTVSCCTEFVSSLGAAMGKLLQCIQSISIVIFLTLSLEVPVIEGQDGAIFSGSYVSTYIYLLTFDFEFSLTSSSAAVALLV